MLDVAAGSPAPERAPVVAGSPAPRVQVKDKAEVFYIGEEDKKKRKKTWVRCTYDTGAAVVAFPMHFELSDETPPSEDVYTTASGEKTPDQGGGALIGWNVMKKKCKMKGRKAPVHKCLAAGHKMAQAGLDSWLTENGGWLMPRRGSIAKLMKEYLDYLMEKHGATDLIPLYVRNGVYCFDILTDADAHAHDAVPIAPLGSESSSSQKTWGFQRQP